jgi:hypothetical protein
MSKNVVYDFRFGTRSGRVIQNWIGYSRSGNILDPYPTRPKSSGFEQFGVHYITRGGGGGVKYGSLPADVLQAGKDLLGAQRSKTETGTSAHRK